MHMTKAVTDRNGKDVRASTIDKLEKGVAKLEKKLGRGESDEDLGEDEDEDEAGASARNPIVLGALPTYDEDDEITVTVDANGHAVLEEDDDDDDSDMSSEGETA
jgi:hypothetical protein